MNPWSWRIALVAAVGLATYAVPLIRVVPLGGSAAAAPAADPKEFVRTFWESQLLPSLAEAAPAADAVLALAADAVAARERFGRAAGVGQGFFVCLRGEGVVVAVGPKAVTLELAGDPAAVVQLSRGPLFGSAIRDAGGMVRLDAFPHSRDFNAVATELNQLAERLVVPRLARLTIGDRVRFAGCGRIGDPAGFVPPLVLAPVLVETP